MTIRYLFDAGPEGANLTSGNTGATIVLGTGATATYAAAKAVNGSFGAKFVANNVVSIARCATEAAGNQQQFSIPFTSPIAATPSGVGFTFFTARISSGVSFRVQWVDGKIQLNDSFTAAQIIKSGATPVAFALNTVYRLELVVTAGSTTAGAFTMNAYSATGTLLGTCGTSSGNMVGPLTAFDVGVQAGVAASVEMGFDSIQSATGGTSEIGAYVPGTNVPPVVSAGSDKTVSVGTVVSQNGSASDPDGSIVTTQWTFNSYPASLGSAPTITGSTTTNASFTPTAAGLYALRLTATDNSGGSTASIATIYVPASQVTVISTTDNSGAWVNVGGAATFTGALSDGLSTTYVESPASPSTKQTYTTRLAPLQPLSPATITLTDTALVGSGNVSVTVELLEGSTVRKIWTPTLGGQVDLPLTAAECGTITSWNALDLRFGIVAV